MEDIIDAPSGEDTDTDFFSDRMAEVRAITDPENNPAPKQEAPKPVEQPKAEAPRAEEQPKADTPISEAPKAEDAVEKDDIDKIETPAGASAKAAADFKLIKETARGYKDKMVAAEGVIAAQKADFEAKEKEYLGKLKEYEAKDAKLAEWEGKSTEYEEAQKELALARVESTEHYKRTIKAPLKAIEDRIAVIAEKNEVGRDKILDIVAERDIDTQRELLEELLPGLKHVDQLTVVRMVEDVRGLLALKDQIEDDAIEANKEIAEKTEKETKAAKEKAAKDFTDGVDHAASELGKRLPFLAMAQGETADGVMANLVQKAKETDFDAASPTTKATAALSVLAVERLLVQVQKITEEKKALEARLNESRAAEPGVGERDKPTPPPVEEGLSFLSKMSQSHNVIEHLTNV